MEPITLVALLVGLLVGMGGAFALERARRKGLRDRERLSHETAARVVEEAKKDADALRREAELQAKELVLRAKNEADHDAKEQRREIASVERRIAQKEEGVTKRLEAIGEREREIQRREEETKRRESDLGGLRGECEALVESVRRKLEDTAGLTRDEARRELVEQMTDEARHEAAKTIRQIEGEAREEAERRAKKIVSIAIERLAGEFIASAMRATT